MRSPVSLLPAPRVYRFANLSNGLRGSAGSLRVTRDETAQPEQTQGSFRLERELPVVVEAYATSGTPDSVLDDIAEDVEPAPRPRIFWADWRGYSSVRYRRRWKQEIRTRRRRRRFYVLSFDICIQPQKARQASRYNRSRSKWVRL